MLIDDQESQLVLVDYQERLMPAIFEADSVLLNAKRLAQRRNGWRFLFGELSKTQKNWVPYLVMFGNFPLGFTQNEFQCLCGWLDGTT
jgi:nicotinamidase-related amidase